MKGQDLNRTCPQRQWPVRRAPGTHLDCLFLFGSSAAKMCTVPWSLDTQMRDASWLKLMLQRDQRCSGSVRMPLAAASHTPHSNFKNCPSMNKPRRSQPGHNPACHRSFLGATDKAGRQGQGRASCRPEAAPTCHAGEETRVQDQALWGRRLPCGGGHPGTGAGTSSGWREPEDRHREARWTLQGPTGAVAQFTCESHS